jgi:hypothetical protein
MEKSIWVRMASALPIVGTALAMWIEHTEMGMAQYGTFLGLLRGALIGLVIAAAMIAASEGVVAAFDMIRFKVKVCCLAHIKYQIGEDANRQAAEELNRPYYERHNPSNSCDTTLPVPVCFWRMLSHYEKLHYILGIYDAVNDDDQKASSLFNSKHSFGEIIGQIDEFYATGKHDDVPLIDALRKVRPQ